jgi:hypothetical protein
MAMGNDLKQALIDLGGSPDAGAASDLGLMVRTPQRPTAQLAHLAEALPPVVETVALAAAAAPSDTDSGAAPAKPPTPLAPKRPVAALAMTFAAALIFGVVGAALALRSFTTPPTATPAAPTTVATRPPASPGASTPPPVTRAPAPATTRPPATSIAARPATPPPATPVTTTLAAADSVSAEARLDRANDFMEKQNFLAALAEARSVLSRQPGNAAAKAMVEDAEAALVVETRIKNAREAIKRGNHEEALAEVRAGLSVNASDSRLIALFRELTK